MLGRHVMQISRIRYLSLSVVSITVLLFHSLDDTVDGSEIPKQPPKM